MLLYPTAEDGSGLQRKVIIFLHPFDEKILITFMELTIIINEEK